MTQPKALQDQLTQLLGSARVKRDEPLSKHTYFKIGGPAELFAEVTSRQELTQTYQTAIKHKVPAFILGGGSNIVISESGIKGLVIKNRTGLIKMDNLQGDIKDKSLALKQAVLDVDSGVITNQLVRYSLDAGLSGLQYFLGLPGTVGGAIYNNSHYQSELIGHFVSQVTVIDKSGQLKTYSQPDLKFSYDYSILQDTHEPIITAKFALKGGDKAKLWAQATDFAKNRANTQPLSQPSSGCMFKNISESEAKKLKLDNPTTSAGYLIDQAGLKGTKIGQIEISDIHANFFVNLGGGTSQDVKKLVKLIQSKIKAKFGVKLEPEVFFIDN